MNEEEPSGEPLDELTRAALNDPGNVNAVGSEPGPPTLWRVLVVIAVAVAALAMVFWRS
jgi:hypothetical protein